MVDENAATVHQHQVLCVDLHKMIPILNFHSHFFIFNILFFSAILELLKIKSNVILKHVLLCSLLLKSLSSCIFQCYVFVLQILT